MVLRTGVILTLTLIAGGLLVIGAAQAVEGGGWLAGALAVGILATVYAQVTRRPPRL